MKTLIPLLSLVLVAPLVQAKDMHLNLDEKCEMSLPHDLKVAKNGFTVADAGKTLMQYQGGTLLIDGQSQPLTAKQRQQLNDFNQGLRDSAKSAAELGVEAIDLASEITTGVLTDVLGEDSAKDVSAGLAQAKAKLQTKLHNEDGTWYIGAGSWDQDSDDFLGKDFEASINKAVQKSMGNVFSQLGDAISNGNGSFEENVQNWADNIQAKADRIEAVANQKGKGIEKKANALCGQLLVLDKQDNQFKDDFSHWVEIIEQ
ncbi:DUF2884 family protein [Gallaecimonas mangrovi]|uniref:DUF2884 family protein n=1 Tax=Gallaecimonas mangrovi TaxID=2291597 RepID=UPI000E2033F6|nr:DUF2884 family protein [Gallaecimonas mangrovi]